MNALYNEIDRFCCDWLSNLMDENLITPGKIDGRSIVDLSPDDVAGFERVHFFAGIGGWDLALQLAGWPGDRPVWTGSCPCQPFSGASVAHGGAQGQADERHLWPEFYRLIRKRRPDAIFGEQVPDAINWGWWDGTAMDLEDEGYACAAQVLRADAIGASHQRKRLYWVADSRCEGRQGHKQGNRVPRCKTAPLAINGDAIARARRALAGDYSDLLHGDGVSVAVERLRAKGYGNAIVPEVAAQFISAFAECRP